MRVFLRCLYLCVYMYILLADSWPGFSPPAINIYMQKKSSFFCVYLYMYIYISLSQEWMTLNDWQVLFHPLHIYTPTYLFVFPSKCTCVYIYIYVYTYMYAWIHIYIYIHVYTIDGRMNDFFIDWQISFSTLYICTYVYVHLSFPLYIYIYWYAYKYMFTHIYISCESSAPCTMVMSRVCWSVMRSGGLGSSTIFKKINEPYTPS